MNNYIDQVIEMLDKSGIQDEYRSFIVQTINNLAITRNDEHLEYILGTPKEFTEQVLSNNHNFQATPSPISNTTSEENNSYLGTDVLYHDDSVADYETNSRNNKGTRPKQGKFFFMYNKSVMFIYKIIVIFLIVSSLWHCLLLLIKYHSHEFNIALLTILLASFAFLAFFGIALEYVRDIINSLLQQRQHLTFYIIKFIITLAFVALTIAIISASFNALSYYVPAGTELAPNWFIYFLI